MRDSIDLNTALNRTKNLYAKLPRMIRPPQKYRAISSRTPEEARALARAVYYSLKKAEESGYIVKTPGGYKMSWKPETK
ncbi:hypothetical protein [Sporolituus thermophilus]|uniref:hypothetical protein n=1 Tax=Sporolituus thermophilus TaxID=608505 RepID=UPI00115F8A9B|nr:hypothetical protein [Sporolituus thermophilus]